MQHPREAIGPRCLRRRFIDLAIVISGRAFGLEILRCGAGFLKYGTDIHVRLLNQM